MQALNKFPQGLQSLPLTQMAKQKHLILFSGKLKRVLTGYEKSVLVDWREVLNRWQPVH